MAPHFWLCLRGWGSSLFFIIKTVWWYIWRTQINIQFLIDVHSSSWHLLTSLSQITVQFKDILKFGVLSKFSYLCPIYCYQFNILFRAKIFMCFYLVTWWMLVKFVNHLHHCILYQMNAKRQSSRHRFSAPDPPLYQNKSSSATLI